MWHGSLFDFDESGATSVVRYVQYSSNRYQYVKVFDIRKKGEIGSPVLGRAWLSLPKRPRQLNQRQARVVGAGGWCRGVRMYRMGFNESAAVGYEEDRIMEDVGSVSVRYGDSVFEIL